MEGKKEKAELRQQGLDIPTGSDEGNLPTAPRFPSKDPEGLSYLSASIP